MQHLQKYIPYVRQHTFVPVPGSDECEEVRSDIFHYILFGGDQLTIVRAEGAQRVRGNSYTGTDKLEGFIAVHESWHEKQCLAEVS